MLALQFGTGAGCFECFLCIWETGVIKEDLVCLCALLWRQLLRAPQLTSHLDARVVPPEADATFLRVVAGNALQGLPHQTHVASVAFGLVHVLFLALAVNVS